MLIRGHRCDQMSPTSLSKDGTHVPVCVSSLSHASRSSWSHSDAYSTSGSRETQRFTDHDTSSHMLIAEGSYFPNVWCQIFLFSTFISTSAMETRMHLTLSILRLAALKLFCEIQNALGSQPLVWKKGSILRQKSLGQGQR